jgi:hypothetical protein
LGVVEWNEAITEGYTMEQNKHFRTRFPLNLYDGMFLEVRTDLMKMLKLKT